MTTLTPHYEEDVLYGLNPEYVRQQLGSGTAPKKDGDEASYLINRRGDETETLKYLRISFRDEWANFVQRLGKLADRHYKRMEERWYAAKQEAQLYQAAAAVVAEAAAGASGSSSDLPEGEAAAEAAAARAKLAAAEEAFKAAANRRQILCGDPMQVSAGQFCCGMPLEPFAQELQLWASMRGQLLARTIKGMLYYQDALKQLNLIRLGERIGQMVPCGMDLTRVEEKLMEEVQEQEQQQQERWTSEERNKRVQRKMEGLEEKLKNSVVEQLTTRKYQYVVSR
jgi:hypothetical protein